MMIPPLEPHRRCHGTHRYLVRYVTVPIIPITILGQGRPMHELALWLAEGAACQNVAAHSPCLPRFRRVH